MGATQHRNPEILCGPNGQPLKPTVRALVFEALLEPMFGETLTRWLAVAAAFDILRLRGIDVTMVEGGASVSLRRNTAAALKSVARFAVEAKILARAPTLPLRPSAGSASDAESEGADPYAL